MFPAAHATPRCSPPAVVRVPAAIILVKPQSRMFNVVLTCKLQARPRYAAWDFRFSLVTAPHRLHICDMYFRIGLDHMGLVRQIPFQLPLATSRDTEIGSCLLSGCYNRQDVCSGILLSVGNMARMLSRNLTVDPHKIASNYDMLSDHDRKIAATNRQRWNQLSRAGVEYSRPYMDLTPHAARNLLDEDNLLDNPEGKEVLVLAGGGGQQTACFALLGARVTVLDLSDEQLARDREAAAVHGYDIRVQQGDMRDLSRFAADAFDMVYHPHSINFVPATAPVFHEVARVLRRHGQYRVDVHNPFTQLVDNDTYRDGLGYGLNYPYRDGEVDLTTAFGTDQWVVKREDGTSQSVDHPRSWVHTFSTLIKALTANGFVLQGIGEEGTVEACPQPGSWEHFKQVTVPYLRLWTRLVPEAFPDAGKAS